MVKGRCIGCGRGGILCHEIIDHKGAPVEVWACRYCDPRYWYGRWAYNMSRKDPRW